MALSLSRKDVCTLDYVSQRIAPVGGHPSGATPVEKAFEYAVATDQIWIGAKGIVINVPAQDGQPMPMMASLHQREAFIVAYEYSAIGRLYNLRIYLVDPLHALDMYSSEE